MLHKNIKCKKIINMKLLYCEKFQVFSKQKADQFSPNLKKLTVCQGGFLEAFKIYLNLVH